MNRMRVRASLFLICAFLLAAPQDLRAEVWSGKCVGVSDGDTISVMHDGRAERVRLNGIDAPESRQAFGSRAKQNLSGLVFGKAVRVDDQGRDRYGRVLGTVYTSCSQTSVNAQMVKMGFAWHYKHYSKDATLAAYEAEARKSKSGLWGDPNPTPPWEFRNGKRTEPAKSLASPAVPAQNVASNVSPLLLSGPQTDAETVYITKSGKKYHKLGCKSLAKSQQAVALSDAKARGYLPCGICKP